LNLARQAGKKVMKPELKKVIVREGLILAVVVIVYMSGFVAVVGAKAKSLLQETGAWAIIIDVIGYSLYLFTRLIVWGIKKLTGK